MTASFADDGNSSDGEKSENGSSVTTQSDSSTPDESASTAKADPSDPSIVIELRDIDAMRKLSKDIQNLGKH